MHCNKCNKTHGHNYSCTGVKLFDVGEQEMKEPLIGRLNNLLTEYDKTMIVRSDGLFEINDKPVEPIIKKSGETWAMKLNGVDYLCIDTNGFDGETLWIPAGEDPLPGEWKPISEIEITDELAKLRPMANIGGGSVVRLIGVQFSDRGYKYHSFNGKSDICRLATVDDLP